MDSEDHSMEKTLGEVTIQKALYERELISSGIRELDEMMGGGFRPGTMTLIQEDLGAGGLAILEKIIEIQLTLENKVLIVYTDPTAAFFVERIRNIIHEEGDLIILDFIQKSKRNRELLFDKHELSLQIQQAQQELMEQVNKAKAEGEDDVVGFIFYLTLNPFLINLDEKTVSRQIFNLAMDNMRNNTISIFLLQKDIINTEYQARILSMFHAVVDLSSEYQGIQKLNYIRILKYVGRYFDPKIVPYKLVFDVNRNKYNFLIKTAFLASFDTYRDLMEWQAGTIYLSKVPFILTPVAYLNMLLEIPLDMNKERGKKELIEKGMAIGRMLTINTEALYHLQGIDLLKATLRGAALQGYGYVRVIDYQIEENLLVLRQTIHPSFHIKPYLSFLDGFYQGMVKRCLRRKVRTLSFNQIEQEEVAEIKQKGRVYEIEIRLDPLIKNNEFE